MRANRHTVPAKRPTPGTDECKLTIILTAANMGKRMKSYGPKSLFDLGNQTLIERQLDVLWHAFPNSDIIVIVGFEYQKICQHLKHERPVRLIYNPLWAQTNVMFSLSLGLTACCTEGVLIIHGDLLFNEEAVYRMTERGSRVLIDTSKRLKHEEVGLVYDANIGLVTNFSYGLPTKWGQMVYVEDRERKILEKHAHNHEVSQRWFLYEGLNRIIAQKGKLRAHQPNGLKLIDIDTIKDLTEAQNHE